MTDEDPRGHPEIGQHGWQRVVKHGLLDSHAGFEKYSEISYSREKIKMKQKFSSSGNYCAIYEFSFSLQDY